jgi:hypothetical protein
MHNAPVPPPPPKVSYLADEDARRVEQLEFVARKMVQVVVTWASRDSDYIGDQFAALWATTRWVCELELPKTDDDFWAGPPVLARMTPPTQQRSLGASVLARASR